MKLINLRKKFLGTLVAVGLAMMLVGCGGTSDGDSSDGDCDCADDDYECKEECLDPVF
jgi:hypothetical protein